MKTSLLLLFLCLSFASFAQMHFSIPVQETDSIAGLDSSAFHFHPIQLDVDLKLQDFNTYQIQATTTFYENVTNSPYYKAKSTSTVSVLQLPKAAFALETALNADKSYNITKLNQILALFELKYRSIPVSQ